MTTSMHGPGGRWTDHG